MNTLFDDIDIGTMTLKNRIIMAPLTRGRAGSNGVPGDIMAEYYQQRASAGLIIAEAAAISEQGRGWLNSPGIYSDQQQAGWAKVADSVHESGGHIFLQLWHMGATVHPDFVAGQQAVSASAVQLEGQLPTPLGRDRTFQKARALSRTEIKQQIKSFARAARRAIDAGLNGVEIHAANGFLIDQFTRDSSNKRMDDYGGSIKNRLRFMINVVTAVCDEIGANKVGIRLSPTNRVWGISDSDYLNTFSQAVKQLNAFNLAYLHLLEPKPKSGHSMATIDYLTPTLRELYNGTVLVNGGYDKNTACEAVASGLADAVSFGLPFIANPDLVSRYLKNYQLALADSTTFYSEGAAGYSDYPLHPVATNA